MMGLANFDESEKSGPPCEAGEPRSTFPYGKVERDTGFYNDTAMTSTISMDGKDLQDFSRYLLTASHLTAQTNQNQCF